MGVTPLHRHLDTLLIHTLRTTGTAPFIRPLDVWISDDVPPRFILCHWDSGASRSTIAYDTASRLGAGTPTALLDPLHIHGCAGHVTRITEQVTLRVRVHASLPYGEETFLLVPGDAPTLLSSGYLSSETLQGVLDLGNGTWTVGPKDARIALHRDAGTGDPRGPPVLPLTPTIMAHTSTTVDKRAEALQDLATTAHPHRVTLSAVQLRLLQNVLRKHHHAFLGPDETNTLPTVEEGDVTYHCEMLRPDQPAQFTCRNRQQPVHLLPAIRTHLRDLLDKGKISVAGPNCATTSWASFHAKRKAEGDD